MSRAKRPAVRPRKRKAPAADNSPGLFAETAGAAASEAPTTIAAAELPQREDPEPEISADSATASPSAEPAAAATLAAPSATGIPGETAAGAGVAAPAELPAEKPAGKPATSEPSSASAPPAGRVAARSRANERPLVFVVSEASVEPPGAARAVDALIAALQRRGRSCRKIRPREVSRVRRSIFVFAGGTTWSCLFRARLNGNRTLVDVRHVPFLPSIPGSARLLDGAIFRNQRQMKDLDRPRWTSRVIYDPPEPGLSFHGVAAGDFRVASFADSSGSELWGKLRGVAFIACDPVRHAGQFNCHLALSVAGAAEAYRPATRVASAAACGAVLVTPRDATAVELLGEDYPFFCAADRPAVEAALLRARRLCGGPEWLAALDRLRTVLERTGLERALEAHLEHFAALEVEPAGKLAVAGPDAAG